MIYYWANSVDTDQKVQPDQHLYVMMHLLGSIKPKGIISYRNNLQEVSGESRGGGGWGRGVLTHPHESKLVHFHGEF